jgi:hypothetical protein
MIADVDRARWVYVQEPKRPQEALGMRLVLGDVLAAHDHVDQTARLRPVQNILDAIPELRGHDRGAKAAATQVSNGVGRPGIQTDQLCHDSIGVLAEMLRVRGTEAWIVIAAQDPKRLDKRESDRLMHQNRLRGREPERTKRVVRTLRDGG